MVCDVCSDGKYVALGGSRGWQTLNSGARTYDLKLECDHCGAILTISGLQQPKWASIKKTQA